MKQCYVPKNFSVEKMGIIEKANQVIDQYEAMGYVLTLRQLYYQFVSRGWLPNKQNEYKRLGEIIGEARLAGLVDWEAMEDRTRNVKSVPHWSSPGSAINSAAYWFRYDKWDNQPWRPVVWVEKEALAGVLDPVCTRLDVTYLACKGYMSLSELWANAQRFRRASNRGQKNLLIHLGDHDPSGVDMTRDIEDRLVTFNARVQVKRIALNMDQIEEQGPPPNPAKLTDSRAQGYIDQYGDESWELDALDPTYIDQIIEEAVLGVRDEEKWAEACAREKEARKRMRLAANNWETVEDYLTDQDELDDLQPAGKDDAYPEEEDEEDEDEE